MATVSSAGSGFLSAPTDTVVTETHAMGVHCNVAMALWRGETTLAGIHDLGKLLRAVRLRHPGGIGLLQVVEPNAPPPDARARNAIASLLAGEREALSCSALVFEEAGFKMAAVRAIVSGITALARPGYPHVVFADVVKGVHWMHGLLPRSGGHPATPAGVGQALARLRQLLDVKSGSVRPEWRAPLAE
jgi:hypothetical protein